MYFCATKRMHIMKVIEAHIKAFEQYLQEQQIFPKDQFENLYLPCNYFLANAGKRIRPTLCLMAAELFGEIPKDAFNIAVGIELFHNFTLLHDDIMDEAPLRRGQETVHLKYGTASAILSGDVMSIYSYKYFTMIAPKILPEVLHVFNQMAIEVCEGQQLDMDYEQQNQVSMEEYLTMIRLKTSVLVGASLQLGALSQNASLKHQKALYELGVNIGIAFQLKDDYLDTFGQQEEIGKLPGGDIRSDKKTCLYIEGQKLIQRVAPDLWEAAWNKEKDEEKVEVVTALFKEYKINEQILSLIQKYSDLAFQQLDDLKQEGFNTDTLFLITEYLLHRAS